MMQSCASAAKLRGGGPISKPRLEGHVQCRVAATSERRLQLGINMRNELQRVSRAFSQARWSRCWSKDKTCRRFAGGH
jgi:hypothetical protein